MFAPMMAKASTTAAASAARKAAQPSAPPPARRSASAHERAPRLQWSIGNQAKLASSPKGAHVQAGEPSHDPPAQEAEPTLTPDRPPGPAWDFSKLPLFPSEPASGPEASAPLPINIQRKLAISSVDDPLEHEADRVADQVMRMPASVSGLSPARPQVSRKCAECEEHVSRKCAGCEEKEKLQKKEAEPQAAVGDVPASVHEALRSPGQPLDAATRAYFEPRFGRDFSRVRVHTGALAEQSAREVGAQAYTVGRNVVFDARRLAPGTHEGRRLIAHELTHVVQQTGTASEVALQRDGKESAAPQDFAVLPSPGQDFVTIATAIAPSAKVLHVTSVDDLAKQLKAIKGPIGTLYFVGHMDEDGDVLFRTHNQKTGQDEDSFVRAETIASTLKGSVQVENVDFRGCDIAQAPGEIEKIRVALKAKTVTGATCTLVSLISNPIKVDGKQITKREDLTSKNQSAFDKGFKQVHDLFTEGKQKCIINDSVDGYFQTEGRLIAYWANPGSMAGEATWDAKKSVCYKDLKVEKVDPKKLPVIGPEDCKLLEVGKK